MRRFELTAARRKLKPDPSLADIERGFHVLKSEIAIAPVFQRLPDSIHAHTSI